MIMTKKRVICTILCIVMAICFTMPTLAETPSDYYEHDYEMYYNFMHQTNEAFGINNETALEEYFSENFDDIDIGDIEDEDGCENCISPIFHSATLNGKRYVSCVEFKVYVPYGYSDGEYCFDGYIIVSPDYCGAFDISGTLTRSVESPETNATHIESINIDNCTQLTHFNFDGQKHCKSFSAINCPALSRVYLEKCDFQRITIQPDGYDKPLDIIAIGQGNLGLIYQNYPDERMVIMTESEYEGFCGFYINGECVHDYVNMLYEGNGDTVYACFAGDINNDGCINVLDANLIMRQALSGSPEVNITGYDLNANGAVSTSDALIAIRIGMGL